MARKNWWWRWTGKGNRQAERSRARGAGAKGLSGGWVRPLMFEELESRLAPAIDLVYADATDPPESLSAADITAYVNNLVSTNSTLRAENQGGNLVWQLYATGLDPNNPTGPTPVNPAVAINTAADLDLTVVREDYGLANGTISLIDFVGDRLTVDLDSLSALDAAFGGTQIDIRFVGGKDFDLGQILGIAIPTALGNDQLVVAGNAGTFSNHPLRVHGTSDIVNDATGVQITSDSKFEFRSDISTTIGAGSNITAANITLAADGTGSALAVGLLANAKSAVAVNGATLTATGGTVTLAALSKVNMTETGKSFGDQKQSPDFTGTLVSSISSANVTVTGATTITAAAVNITATVNSKIQASVSDPNATIKALAVFAAGDPRVTIGDNTGTTTITATGPAGTVTAEAHNTVTVIAQSQPSTDTGASVDAAVVSVNVVDAAIPVLVPAGFHSGAAMTVGGNAVISAGNKASFKATDVIAVTTTADGAVPGTAGATFAVTVVDSDTTAALTGNAAVTAPTVDLLASTTRTIATTTKSTPGGAQDDNNTGTKNQSQQALADNKTGDGDLTIAGAVAVSHVSGTTTAFVNSTAPTAVTAATALTVGSASTDSASAVADASGTGSPGLAVAAALNFVDIDVDARLGGTAPVNLQAATVSVSATENGASTFKADATSGAGSQNVGIAGALSINSVDTATRAAVGNGTGTGTGTTVNLNGGSLTVSATSSTKSTSEAKPKEGAGGESLGLGASVALSLIDNLTEAAVQNGAAVNGGGTVKIAATGDHDIETKATMSASGGVAITPVVALAFPDNTTRVVFAGAEVRDTHTHLLFDLVNPNADPVPYHGYTANSFEPKLPDGTIAPLYKIEYHRGGAWKDDSLGWCGFGIGPVSVVGEQKARFDVPLYQDEWDEVRVGVAWYAGGRGKDSQTAWSKPVSRKDVKRKSARTAVSTGPTSASSRFLPGP